MSLENIKNIIVWFVVVESAGGEHGTSIEVIKIRGDNTQLGPLPPLSVL